VVKDASDTEQFSVAELSVSCYNLLALLLAFSLVMPFCFVWPAESANCWPYYYIQLTFSP